MKKMLTKIFGDPQAKTLKRLKKRISSINELEPVYEKMSLEKLAKQTQEFKKQLKDKKTLDDILPHAFAVVREVSKRTLGMRHFDVQLIGGMALHEGNVAEMKTGEGKTLVATAPVYLNALTGKGVHVVTVNDYLAQRDAGWMAQVYHALGLTTGVIVADRSFIYDPEFSNKDHIDERMSHLKPCTRKEAYAADVTYGTNNEFGFDYLRDNMVNTADNLRQRELNFAIVDEVDSILIDEARTPLIISAPSMDSGSGYSMFAEVARKLVPEDYELDEKRRSVALNDSGVEKVQKLLKIENLYDPEHIKLIYHMDQALKAETLFHREKEYVITKDGEIVIVDEFTGRLMHGRRYNEGLHQAIEAKEGVEVQQESMTLATISFQNYFRLYDKLSGMTGTAATEAEEFNQIYGIDVIEIPANRPVAREDRTDRIYKTELGKFKALINEVKTLHKKGQPVLIGTVSIEKNELLSGLLTEAKVPHQVLNAKNNEGEAEIVSKAGQKGAVTLATNIAGRGTDIVLGEGVKELGGLVVLGSERHESRRIDNQLRGRCGRQGDPGMTQFYVSCEDDLMRIFGGDRIASLMEKLGVEEDQAIENRAVSKTLENAQKKVEGYNFDTRKNVVQYDDVMNRHRKAVYTIRKRALLAEDISKQIKLMVEQEAESWANEHINDGKEFYRELEATFPFGQKQMKDLKGTEDIKARVKSFKEYAYELYVDREEALGTDVMRQVEREAVMQVLDQLWMEHLENMEHLRSGIGWRSIGQKDPLVEYRREGQGLFEQMQSTLRNEVVRGLNHLQPHQIQQAVETELTKMAKNSTDNANQITTGVATSAEDFEGTVVKRVKVPVSKTKSGIKKSRKQQRQNRRKKH
ncbi:preprotein translocase subunit SecA [Candidatus Nomurabacteria bacterium]|nr:preprotein translocase subunit SecA [Candidatus Saccharibacteria bacterium]MCA9313381.1 preprotein translocase subunit SecA [Candidatus Saccharibacteria bacterium]MCB9822308.1 preprotein translocase subunit SecA [Candidatus Nomurabacteria bacterium]